jgi:sulfate adenylyltransferase subunit 1
MHDALAFVLVGHVDHGKSTLIGRLLYDTDSLAEGKIEEIRRTCEDLGREMEFGFLMDHLEEERSQGITIDTAQTFFKTGRRRYVIIDAPGHQEFVQNMITGTSQAEAAVLVVDAREGVREQTRRHACILSMLGLRQVIAVVNKMDLVNYAQYRFREVQQDLLACLSSMGIQPHCTIPISARNGENVALETTSMPWYEGPTVLHALDSLTMQGSANDAPLRFAVQDVYQVKGKRILVGRVASGKIRQGDELIFLPQDTRTKVQSIEILWQDRAEAEAGECIGITVADLLCIQRGAVACSIAKLPSVTFTLCANVFWMSREPFCHGDSLTLRIATQETLVSIRIVKKIDSSTLEPIVDNLDQVCQTEVAEMVIETQQPVVVESFNDVPELGRFVLVRHLDVVAGGIVTQIGNVTEAHH